MLGAVIRYGNNTLVVELPTGTMDLQSKLSSIGIQNHPKDILLADEDSNPIRVKLYAGSPEEAHLLTLLTPERSLADANGSMIVLNHSAPEIQSHLRYGLIADRYSSLDGYLDEAKQLLQNKREPAKNEETKENPKLANALRLYENNPNMRVDYLFGRIEEKCPNVEVLDISKKTGLSVEAVKRLMFCWISRKECGMIQLFHPFGGVPMANLMKKEIKTTFLRLLEERPYHQITVKEIVKECGINRNSFYYHYADLPALVEEVIDEEIGRFVREQNSFSSMEESLTDALSFFREHKRAAYHVYNSVNRDIFDRYLMKNCESVSIGYVNSILANTALSEDDLQAIIHFNAYVCYGAVTRWLESGMTYDLHEDFRRMFQLMIEPAMKQQGMTVESLK